MFIESILEFYFLGYYVYMYVICPLKLFQFDNKVFSFLFDIKNSKVP
jgi:hypothetical protein